MKFKYIGEDGCFCIELSAFKVVPAGEYLKKGQEIEVPNDLERVIKSLDASGLFVRIQDNKKKVTKKEKK